jgi:predicted transporter
MITLKTLVDTAKLAAYGLGIAILMGVFFGLTIGLGGAFLGIETSRLLTLGAMSGWASGFVAMVCVFLRLKRRPVSQT